MLTFAVKTKCDLKTFNSIVMTFLYQFLDIFNDVLIIELLLLLRKLYTPRGVTIVFVKQSSVFPGHVNIIALPLSITQQNIKFIFSDSSWYVVDEHQSSYHLFSFFQKLLKILKILFTVVYLLTASSVMLELL